MAARKPPALNRADHAFEQGLAMLRQHPMFEGLLRRASVRRHPQYTQTPAQGWLVASVSDALYLHPTRLAEPGEWAFVLAQGLLYLGMERFERDRAIWPAWSAACDVVIVRLLRTLKLGQVPAHVHLPEELPGWDEARWYTAFVENGVPDWAAALSPAGPGHTGMLPPADTPAQPSHRVPWATALAEGISRSVQLAVEAASGQDRRRLQGPQPLSLPTERARSWFISSFPLLGAMVSAFEFIEHADLCRREEIQVAAVDEVARTIYLNPAAGLTESERRFVIAHEVLHVSLRHLGRRRGRDAYLWNVACDYVINGWLIEMGVGTPPALGLLHDVQLAGLSAEEVYDRIVTDLRRARKLATLAGRQGDMLERRIGGGHLPAEGTDLDAFYRSMLARGLALHDQQGRGLLPAGLIEEIRALLQPPIPWDVKLAQWFDHHFPPIEKQRSYARPSRRQASTPDIPRARWVVDPRWLEGRTFGVVLDTSGSMDRHLLARALGAIASYAAARDVPAARVVFCDAAPHDAGYLPADEIAGRVEVRGRGGTVLQPGIDLLQDARDFPAEGPILVITDGACDTLAIRRSHAYLLPEGRRLPFRPVGDVFYLN
jgi:predicted metal-dependent peptidase